MGPRLKGRAALVTGATSGLGRAIAAAFADEGAHVVLSGRDQDRGAAAVAAIRAAGGTADFVAADLGAGAAAARALAGAASDALGRIDVLVNNAGVFPFAPTVEVDEETYDSVFAVNVKAAFFLTASVVPGMIQRGSGIVLNVGSNIAFFAVPQGALYSASKVALHALTTAWAAEFGPHGVRVNALAPGLVATEGIGGASETLDAIAQRSPARRHGTAEEVAQAATYLASDESRYVHGTVLTIDGGYSAVATA